MASFAEMHTMGVWYAHLSEDELLDSIRRFAAEEIKEKPGKAKRAEKEIKPGKVARQAEKAIAKAHTRDSLQALSKLGELVDGRLDRSLLDYSERYADQNERDHAAFTDAVRSGRLEALEGV